MRQPVDSIYSKYTKRLLDIICSGFALIVLCIPMLIIAIIIRFNMGQPVLFTQSRIGESEVRFKLLKFRSMKDAFDEFGVPLPDEQRITRFGRFIRKTSIDELPSLINIIKGDMSVIGPRPLPWNYRPWFKTEERIRHSVRGGLTGYAQVNGRNALSWEERFRCDLYYVSNISFFLDLKILLLTIVKVSRKEDIGERGNNPSHGDFHSERSGLRERELHFMEINNTLPLTYEEWLGLTENQKRERYEESLSCKKNF